jgi:hypothetical protein
MGKKHQETLESKTSSFSTLHLHQIVGHVAWPLDASTKWATGHL